MNVDLKGPELSKHLAVSLTDLEFELLIRERIKLQFENAHARTFGLGESHNTCQFTYNWNDKSQWRVELGSTYNDQVSLRGEVLTRTVINCGAQYEMQHGNKLSLLLPPPAEPEPEEPTEEKRW